MNIVCGVDAAGEVAEGSANHAMMRALALKRWHEMRGAEKPARETLTVVPIPDDANLPAHLSGMKVATRLDLWADG